ncbi:retrovirus-related pol polyprotein from transposon TNT 1-94, partial [Tanacetum coccineum]
MTGNRRLFTSYKAYDGGHVVFRSNLKGKVIGGGNITHDSIIVTNFEHVSGLAFNLINVESKDDVLEKFKILCTRLENLDDCSIVSIKTNHRGEFDKLQFESFCEQHGMSYNLTGPFTSQSSEIVERKHRNLPEPKSSPLVEDDRINEPIVQDLNGSPLLQVNVSDKGYPKGVKEARGHPIKQVIGELNERTL